MSVGRGTALTIVISTMGTVNMGDSSVAYMIAIGTVFLFWNDLLLLLLLFRCQLRIFEYYKRPLVCIRPAIIRSTEDS